MSKQSTQQPRALIHKRILSAAAAHPDASFEEISADIGGASPGLVERVLNQYGDPAEETTQNTTTMATEQSQIDLDDLSDAQRETIEAVAAKPDATQQEIANELDISSATVSHRLQKIEEFEWADRGRIIADLFDLDGETSIVEQTAAAGETETDSNSDTSNIQSGDKTKSASKTKSEVGPDQSSMLSSIEEQMTELMDVEACREELEPIQDRMSDLDDFATQVASIENIDDRLTHLEETVEAIQDEVEQTGHTEFSSLESEIEAAITDGGEKANGHTKLEDSELVAKVIRASMADDDISEEEELQIIDALR